MGNLRALHLQALPRRDVHGRSACIKHALERVEQSQDRLPRRRRRQQQLLKREHIPHFLNPREGKFEGSRVGHALAEGRGSSLGAHFVSPAAPNLSRTLEPAKTPFGLRSRSVKPPRADRTKMVPIQGKQRPRPRVLCRFCHVSISS